jgi:calcineurin-like phosphoesterase
MGLADDPIRAIEAELANLVLGRDVQAILIDVHAEATSEKLAHGHLFDGRVSAVVGTHTHVPTADARLLAGRTGFMTDVGMTGDYDSVIGMDKHASMDRWRSALPGRKMEPAQGEATLCAVFIETDDATGLATRIEPVRVGGTMPPNMPAP